MTLHAEWVVPVGLGLLGSIFWILNRRLKKVPVRHRNPRRR